MKLLDRKLFEGRNMIPKTGTSYELNVGDGINIPKCT